MREEYFNLQLASQKHFSASDINSNETIGFGLRSPRARNGNIEAATGVFSEAGVLRRPEEQAFFGAPWPAHASRAFFA
jgi:hypothetical protein